MEKSKVKSGNSQIIWLCFLFVCVCPVASDDSDWPDSCGFRKLNIGGLVRGGSDSKLNNWPWLAVLCHGSGTADCFCGANLITKRHVITAAHCLHAKDAESTYWSNVTVHFGKHNLYDNSEDSQSRSVIDVVIHPEWKTKTTVTDGDRYDADIAILRLNKAVTFNKRVQPICLPSAYELNDLTGKVVSKILIAY